MKANKKMVMALCFSLGLLLFVTTAFADITSLSGYDQLKDTFKFTAENLSEKLQSFTIKSTVTLKDNDKVLVTSNSTEKYDNKNMTSENSASSEYSNGNKRTSYSYNGKDKMIWFDSMNDIYYESNSMLNNDSKLFTNPFKEDRAKDIEKIADAIVGNLKDYVIVDNKADGSKELSGSLSEGQIPALVNAVSSFLFKQKTSRGFFRGEEVPIPMISDDIFVKNITGKAVINKDGLLESILATGVLSGKDKSGKSHDITLEILGKIVDINSTVVSKPDLTGKKVEKQVGRSPDQDKITSKFVGKYKNDIIIEKDNKFVKVGERIVEITSVTDKQLSGHYYEQYKKEYPDYEKNKLDFTFNADIGQGYNTEFKFVNSKGEEMMSSLSFDMMNSRLYFNIPYPTGANGVIFDSNFSRAFDE